MARESQDRGVRESGSGSGRTEEPRGSETAQARVRPVPHQPSAAMVCHCGRTVEPRDPDPWEGRMDDYCEDCAINRCDCYPNECPVKYPQASSAASTAPRRRTVCVYCGRRIPGAVPQGDTSTREQRFAARVACREHWNLVARDPHYNHEGACQDVGC